MEWAVVGVIVVLLGLITSIVRPIVSLVQNMTKLSVIVERLDARSVELGDEHEEMWDKIDDHEKRIYVLERSDEV